MKALLRKRWFRITTSIVLAAAILLGAAVPIANRRGTQLLQQELAAARAAGLPLTRTEMDADQPPPDRNAALHGILHEWELAMARPDEPGAKEVLAVLEPFQKPSWQEPWRKSRRPREKPLSYRERKLGRTAPPIAGPPAPDLPEGSAHFWVMDKRDGYKDGGTGDDRSW